MPLKSGDKDYLTIVELEKALGRNVPQIESNKVKDSVGYSCREGKVTKLGLKNSELAQIPRLIASFSHLEILYLDIQQLKEAFIPLEMIPVIFGKGRIDGKVLIPFTPTRQEVASLEVLSTVDLIERLFPLIKPLLLPTGQKLFLVMQQRLLVLKAYIPVLEPSLTDFERLWFYFLLEEWQRFEIQPEYLISILAEIDDLNEMDNGYFDKITYRGKIVEMIHTIMQGEKTEVFLKSLEQELFDVLPSLDTHQIYTIGALLIPYPKIRALFLRSLQTTDHSVTEIYAGLLTTPLLDNDQPVEWVNNAITESFETKDEQEFNQALSIFKIVVEDLVGNILASSDYEHPLRQLEWTEFAYSDIITKLLFKLGEGATINPVIIDVLNKLFVDTRDMNDIKPTVKEWLELIEYSRKREWEMHVLTSHLQNEGYIGGIISKHNPLIDLVASTRLVGDELCYICKYRPKYDDELYFERDSVICDICQNKVCCGYFKLQGDLGLGDIIFMCYHCFLDFGVKLTDHTRFFIKRKQDVEGKSTSPHKWEIMSDKEGRKKKDELVEIPILKKVDMIKMYLDLLKDDALLQDFFSVLNELIPDQRFWTFLEHRKVRPWGNSHCWYIHRLGSRCLKCGESCDGISVSQPYCCEHWYWDRDFWDEACTTCVVRTSGKFCLKCKQKGCENIQDPREDYCCICFSYSEYDSCNHCRNERQKS